jgi:hypothetical protein
MSLKLKYEKIKNLWIRASIKIKLVLALIAAFFAFISTIDRGWYLLLSYFDGQPSFTVRELYLDYASYEYVVLFQNDSNKNIFIDQISVSNADVNLPKFAIYDSIKIQESLMPKEVKKVRVDAARIKKYNASGKVYEGSDVFNTMRKMESSSERLSYLKSLNFPVSMNLPVYDFDESIPKNNEGFIDYSVGSCGFLTAISVNGRYSLPVKVNIKYVIPSAGTEVYEYERDYIGDYAFSYDCTLNLE